MNLNLYNYFKQYWIWILAAIMPLAIFLSFYPNYLRNSTFFWVCIVTLPLSLQSSSNKNRDHLFWLAIGMSAISLLLPTTIGVYLVLCLTIFFLIQSIVGRLHYTLIIHALLISPLFSYFRSLISFPIRLQLSSIVTFLLQAIGADVQIEGNLVQLGDTSFLVDEACAGMFMLGYGLLFGTIILSHFTKRKILTFKSLVLYYFLLFALIYSGNVVRITLLILFHIMPDHWLHEGLGQFIFVFQILIPFYLIVQLGTKKFYIHNTKKDPIVLVFPRKKYVLLCLLMALIIARQHSKMDPYELSGKKIDLPGYQSTVIKGNVTKLQNEQSLIYIKPPVAPYRADHNPMICWRGSGYTFKKIEKWPINNIIVNRAELLKGDDKIYTAWWFQSQNHKTGDQLVWRKYSLLNNEDFYLINLSCNTKEDLDKQLRIILNQNILSKSKKTTHNES